MVSGRGGATRGRQDRRPQPVRKLGGLGGSNRKQVRGSTASFPDTAQHEMQAACIQVGAPEMENSGPRWVFWEVETTRHTDRLDVVRKHDTLMDLRVE